MSCLLKDPGRIDRYLHDCSRFEFIPGTGVGRSTQFARRRSCAVDSSIAWIQYSGSGE
jgi:hypothetical protein